ncbi:MAG: hypothetical protein H6739_25745 [Alphaproteobacteria bacterium]|nr:hypothetical protein [Alphaproteobacteria bacterium]
MWDRLLLLLISALLVLPGAAYAYAPDGSTLDWLGAFGVEVPPPPQPIQVSPRGEARLSIPLALPPARLQPGLSLDYDARGGADRELPYGWRLGGLVEIQRPNTRAYRSTEFLLSGPGFGGRLDCASSPCRLVHTTPDLEVQATYDSATDSWTVESSAGITFTLEDNDAGSPTARWRVTSWSDRMGNAVEVSYDAQDRVDTLSFGGNLTTGDAHLATLVFTYGTGAAMRTTARAGFVEEASGALTDITLWMEQNGTWTRQRAWALGWVARPGESATLLESLTLVGFDGTRRMAEPPMRFRYSPWSGTTTPAPDSGVYLPGDLSRVVVQEDRSGLVAEVWQESALFDFNGDGLPDHVESDGQGLWVVTNQERDPFGEHHWAGGAQTFAGPPSFLHRWTRARGLHEQTTRLTDLDGDGNPDLLSTTEVNGGPSTTWAVWYGDGNRFDRSYTPEAAPVEVIHQEDPWAQFAAQVTQTLVDVNGDGWQDIVRLARSGPAEVFLHSGLRGGGWLSGQPVDAPWCDDMGPNDAVWCGLSQVEVDQSGAVVSDIYTGGGFVDLNGDGLVDYVIDPWLDWLVGAPASAPWTVYLGNGEGWEPARAWTGPSTRLSWRTAGDPNLDKRVLQGLMDVDGDGLLDAVEMVDLSTGRAVHQWYRNLGDGFDTTPLPTPSTWLRGLATLGITEVQSTTTGAGTRWEHVELASVRDLNHDKQPDSAHLNTSTFTRGPLVEWGDYPGPHLLIEVDTGAGRLTEVAWQPSSAAWPAGDPGQLQRLPIALDLVAEVFTEDLLSGAWASTDYTFYGGVFEDQAFQGFEGRDVTLTASDRQLRVEEEDYDLSLELPPALTDRRIYTDACRAFAPALQRCRGPQLLLRIHEQQTWDWFGSHSLVDTLTMTQEADDTGGALTAQQWSVDYDYDSAGFLTHLVHDGGDGASLDGDLEVELEYVTHGVLQRVSEERVYGWDGLASTWREHQRRRWDYDHTHGGLVDGLLTGFGLAAFWAEAGETPSTGPWRRVEMQHGPRGEVLQAIEHDTGLTRSFTWTFGDALVEVEDDGVHLTEHRYDQRGRLIRVDDLANGVASETEWDALDRPIHAWTEDQTGARFLVSSRSIVHSSLPFTERTSHFDSAGNVERTTGVVFDGGGNAAVQWLSHPSGGYAVQGFTHDLWGRERARTERCASSVMPMNTSTSCPTLAESWWDSLGQTRVIDRDVNDPNLRVMENPAAWQVHRTDEEGFLHRTTFDAFGRPVAVETGRGDSLVPQARYEYDPLGRLIAMTDAAGVRTTWSADGAGRVRAARSPDIGERLYHYVGAHPQRVEDSAGGWAEWSRDALGRPQQLHVSDPLSGVLTTTWTWDRAWVGERDGHTDPFGSEQRAYDAQGRTSLIQRTWSDGTAATWAWGHDLEGRVDWTRTPSGRLLEARRDQGFTETLRHNGAILLQAGWDLYGRAEGWQSRSGVELRRTSSPEGELESVSLRLGAQVLAERDIVWKANGLAGSVDEGSGPSTFIYDDHMQLQGVTGPWTEAFGWGPGGDVFAQITPSGRTWSWTPPVGHHKPTSRTDGVVNEVFTWDSAGRLETWDDGTSRWTFRYDGLSRLRAVERNGRLALVLECDADGQIVRRIEGDPADPNAPVEHALGDWRRTTSGSVLEDIRVDGQRVGFFQDGQVSWALPELGGTVAAVVDDFGVLQSERKRSAFGAVRSASGVQDAPGLHGHREEPGGLPLLAAGARHLLLGAGMWLQPEPLLLERPGGSILEDPLRLHPYRYARNSPTSFHDPDGRIVDTIADGLFILYDVYTLWQEPGSSTNWMALGADGAGAAVPFLTGGGMVVRVTTKGDHVVDGVNAVGKMAPSADEVAAAGRELVEEGAEWVGTKAAELRPYGGPGGGHHVPAKSAFRGADAYDVNKALAIPNAELKRLGVAHSAVSGAQASAYRAFSTTGGTLTWDVVARIEVDALVKGGMSRDMAAATVQEGIIALQKAGVPGPTRIPWGP